MPGRPVGHCQLLFQDMVGKAEPLIPEELVSTRSTPSVGHRGELPPAPLGRSWGSESTCPVACRGCPGHGEVGAAPADGTPAIPTDSDGTPLRVGNPLHPPASPHWHPHLHRGSWTRAWLPLGTAPPRHPGVLQQQRIALQPPLPPLTGTHRFHQGLHQHAQACSPPPASAWSRSQRGGGREQMGSLSSEARSRDTHGE